MRVTQKTFDAFVTSIAGLFVTAERLRHIALVKAVYPDNSRLNFPDEPMRLTEIACPDTSSQPVNRVVSNSDPFINAVEFQRGKKISDPDADFLILSALNIIVPIPLFETIWSLPSTSVVSVEMGRTP